MTEVAIEVEPLDVTRPTLPDELLRFPLKELPSGDVEKFAELLDDLWTQVLAELQDMDYRSRAHHSTTLYNDGCHGPLCRKAMREYSNRKAIRRDYNPRLERRLDPILEYYHTIAKLRILQYNHRLLTAIKAVS